MKPIFWVNYKNKMEYFDNDLHRLWVIYCCAVCVRLQNVGKYVGYLSEVQNTSWQPKPTEPKGDEKLFLRYSI